MIKSFQLTYPSGLHARPSTMLAQIVKQFDAQVSINCDNEKADARDVLHVLSLGVFPGEIQFEAEGPDASKALDAIEKFIANLNKNPML